MAYTLSGLDNKVAVVTGAGRGFCAGVEIAIKALAWMVRLTKPLFTVALFGHDFGFSGRDLILLGGGLFLLRLEQPHGDLAVLVDQGGERPDEAAGAALLDNPGQRADVPGGLVSRGRRAAHRGPGLVAERPPAARGRVVVRHQRHQRAPDHRGGTGRTG